MYLYLMTGIQDTHRKKMDVTSWKDRQIHNYTCRLISQKSRDKVERQSTGYISPSEHHW